MVLLLLAAVTACGSGPVGRGPAATVNGREISVDRVEGLLHAQQRYLESEKKKAGAQAASVQDSLDKLLGQGVDSFSTASAAEAVGSWVVYELILDDLEGHGKKITAKDRSTARAKLVEQVGSEEALQKIDADLVSFSIDSNAAYLAVQRLVTASASSSDREQQLRDLYETTKATTPLCLRLIYSETEAAAQAAKARVDGGEDFAEVAADVSADTQTAANGGYAGCATAAEATQAFGSDFTKAAVGDVVGPVTQANGGVLLLQVASVTGPTFEDAKAQLEQQLDAQTGDTGVSAYIAKLAKKAQVIVDPRFGTWDAATGSVVPPAAPDAPLGTSATTVPAVTGP